MNPSPSSNRFRLLHVFLALLLAQGVLHALTPGPTVIWQCPGCKAALRELTMGSGNTMGAKFWTDGKCEAPMMLFRYPAAKCAQCSHVFILETATQLDQIGWDTDREKKEKK